jgi:uncharacterized protein YndB with AHSA1/START domain
MAKLNLVAEPGSHAVVVTRDFDAPRDLVFKAYTDPKLITRWWGSGTVVDQMEVRPGGLWRYVEHAGDGQEYAFHGVYHAISAPERLVYTFEFEGMPGHVLLETIILEEEAGKTKLTDLMVFQTVADRDGMLSSGMETGATESLDRLEALLAKV